MANPTRQQASIIAKAIGLFFSGGVIALGLALASGLIEWGSSRAEAREFKAHIERTEPMAERFIVTEQIVLEMRATLKELVTEVKGLRRDADRRDARDEERNHGR